MIIGIGSDIVNITRIENIINKFGERFINKIFTLNEQLAAKKISHIPTKNCFFAKRFAAKEAFTKALGMGFRKGIKFQDIEIVNNRYGKPSFVIENDAKLHLEDLAINQDYQIKLSMSDDYPMAIAFVIIAIV